MRPPTNKTPGRPRSNPLCERQQDEILEAVARVFARHGYRGTEMQYVADALHSGKGTIYRYFHSKEELFLAAVDLGMRRLHEAVQISGAGVADPLARVSRAVAAFLAFFRARPEFAELLIQERAEFRDRRRPTYLAHREANAAPWRELYQALMAQGRVRSMPVERILNVLGDLVYGAMFTNHFAVEPDPVEEQARNILDIVFHGILSDRERDQGEPARLPTDHR